MGLVAGKGSGSVSVSEPVDTVGTVARGVELERVKLYVCPELATLQPVGALGGVVTVATVSTVREHLHA